MSLQKLLFTHKPLDTSDKGVQVQSYQNLINEGFEILQTRIITGFSDFFNLFPLYCSDGLWSEVEKYAVYAVNLFCNTVGYMVE